MGSLYFAYFKEQNIATLMFAKALFNRSRVIITARKQLYLMISLISFFECCLFSESEGASGECSSGTQTFTSCDW